MDKILIKDLIAHGIIGVYDWERREPQKILINVILFTDLHKASREDDINYSIDYEQVAKQIKRHAEEVKRLTVEALAGDLANICLQYPGVDKVTIRVEKPDAIEFTSAVGVEITRSQIE